MQKKKPTPTWYVISTLLIFLITLLIDIIDPYTHFSRNLVFALIYTLIGSFLYMIFQAIFIIRNYKLIEKEGILLAIFAFVSLIMPLIFSFAPYIVERTLTGYIIFYTMPAITVFFASYLIYKKNHK